MKLGAFSLVRNGIRNGYPFIESYLSVLPFVDEFVIIEAYSEDETYKYLRKLQDMYPKIRLIRGEWKKSPAGGIIAELGEKAKKECRADWLLYVQADEIWHPEELKKLHEYPLKYPDKLGFEFWFRHFHTFDFF